MLKEYQTETGAILMVSDDGKVFHNGYELKQSKRGEYYSVNIQGHRYSIHRLVASCFIKPIKFSDKNIHVHHKDGNKDNNKVENLEILAMKEHQTLHHQKYPLTKICIICGKTYTPHKTKRERAKTCSKECWLESCKRHGASCRKQILQYTKTGEFVKKWDSLTAIQDELNCFASNIVKCCKGQISTYKGYVWKYAI